MIITIVHVAGAAGHNQINWLNIQLVLKFDKRYLRKTQLCQYL